MLRPCWIWYLLVLILQHYLCRELSWCPLVTWDFNKFCLFDESCVVTSAGFLLNIDRLQYRKLNLNWDKICCRVVVRIHGDVCWVCFIWYHWKRLLYFCSFLLALFRLHLQKMMMSSGAPITILSTILLLILFFRYPFILSLHNI